jgi:hypothetical protein
MLPGNQTVMMLIDAFLPEGITRLAVDSIFMMPHLGVLSEISSRAATECFEKTVWSIWVHVSPCW